MNPDDSRIEWDLLVAITAWNVKDYVEKCLHSIFQNRPTIRFKVVLLDDASGDGVADVVGEKFLEVDLIVNDRNQGFIKANNRILRTYRNRSRYFLLLNADTIVLPNAFDVMVSFLDSHPQAGIAGCKVVRSDGTLDWPCKRSFQTPSIFFYRALKLDRLFPKSKRFGRYHLTYLDEDETHEVDAVVGAFLMIRNETLNDIGLLDESLVVYSDDMDWCARAKAMNWKVYYHPEVQIIHFKSRSLVNRSYRSIYYWYYSTLAVYRKHTARNYNVIVNALVVAGFGLMCGLSLIQNFFRKSKSLPSRI
jgi:hypothetical protein